MILEGPFIAPDEILHSQKFQEVNFNEPMEVGRLLINDRFCYAVYLQENKHFIN